MPDTSTTYYRRGPQKVRVQRIGPVWTVEGIEYCKIKYHHGGTAEVEYSTLTPEYK